MLKHNEKGMRKFTRNELLKVYSKELRDLETSEKKSIMINFIKDKFEFTKVKDFIDKTDLSSKLIIDLNKIDNLNIEIYKELFELEQIFMFSVLHTKDFKDYALNALNNNNKEEEKEENE